MNSVRTESKHETVFSTHFFLVLDGDVPPVRVQFFFEHDIRWARLAAAHRRNSQILLVLPRPGPELAGPAL